MATTRTFNFTANPVTIKIPSYASGGGGLAEFSNTQSHSDPVVRAVAEEYAETGATSGTVTISVD